jgi:hypothetical protein
MANLTCRRCAATVQSAALRCHFCGTLCPTVDWLGACNHGVDASPNPRAARFQPLVSVMGPTTTLDGVTLRIAQL